MEGIVEKWASPPVRRPRGQRTAIGREDQFRKATLRQLRLPADLLGGYVPAHQMPLETPGDQGRAIRRERQGVDASLRQCKLDSLGFLHADAGIQQRDRLRAP